MSSDNGETVRFDLPGLSVLVAPVGGLRTNCCIVLSSGEAVVADPGGDPDRILDVLARENAEPSRILLTHAHADHFAAAAALKDAFPDALLCLHRAEKDWPRTPSRSLSYWLGDIPPCPAPDTLFEEGFTFPVGDAVLEVLHLPGHTPGSSAFLDRASGVLVSGDVLFAGSIGRTDLPGSDPETMDASLRRLLRLSPETLVLPGHGPETTIGKELETNPFLEDLR